MEYCSSVNTHTRKKTNVSPHLAQKTHLEHLALTLPMNIMVMLKTSAATMQDNCEYWYNETGMTVNKRMQN
jgi:hypothetical protein